MRRSAMSYLDSRVIDDRASALQAQLRSAHRFVIVAQRPEILTVNPGVLPNSLAESRLCPPYKSL